jgi:hypothetical protein
MPACSSVTPLDSLEVPGGFAPFLGRLFPQ